MEKMNCRNCTNGIEMLTQSGYRLQHTAVCKFENHNGRLAHKNVECNDFVNKHRKQRQIEFALRL